MSKANLLFKLFFYNRNQMTTVDTLKFPVNRFIIAASSVWKYKQFPHLIIGRIWGSLTLPRQDPMCNCGALRGGLALSFLLFAVSRSPRLFPEIIKWLFPLKIDMCVRRKEMTLGWIILYQQDIPTVIFLVSRSLESTKEDILSASVLGFFVLLINVFCLLEDKESK